MNIIYGYLTNSVSLVARHNERREVCTGRPLTMTAKTKSHRRKSGNAKTNGESKMGIDTRIESLITLAEAATEFERIGVSKPHIESLRRWVTGGTGGVRLGVVKVGGRLYTSPEAVMRFVSDGTAGVGTH